MSVNRSGAFSILVFRVAAVAQTAGEVLNARLAAHALATHALATVATRIEDEALTKH